MDEQRTCLPASAQVAHGCQHLSSLRVKDDCTGGGTRQCLPRLEGRQETGGFAG